MTRRTLHWLSPGDPDQRTGGYIYNRRMIDALVDMGVRVQVHVLQGDWPIPAAPTPVALPPGDPVVADGLLLTGLAQVLPMERNPIIALVHSPLCREGPHAAHLRAPEAQALGRCAGVLVTSPAAGQDVAALFGVTAKVVVPGADPAPPAPCADPTRLLCPATLTPRKGHLVLLAALGRMADTPWSLVVAGSPDRDPAHAAAVHQAAAPLGDRVRFVGELDDAGMAQAYADAGLVVLTSFYETYGMVLIEAAARGIPVVSTPSGAATALGPAAVSVRAGDVDDTEAVLRRWLGDPAHRARTYAAAAAYAPPRWPQQAEQLRACVQRIAGPI